MVTLFSFDNSTLANSNSSWETLDILRESLVSASLASSAFAVLVLETLLSEYSIFLGSSSYTD